MLRVTEMGLIDDILNDDDNSLGTLVAENAQWRLWKNGWTKSYEDQLNEYDEDGFTLQGRYFVVLAENKTTGERTYLMLDKATQQPFANWSDSISFDFKKKLILMDLKDECNVVNMAKNNKKKKKKVKR